MKKEFHANFRYTIKETVPENKYNLLSTGSYGDFDSHCDGTMIGFLQNRKTSSEEGGFACAFMNQLEAYEETVLKQETDAATYFEVNKNHPTKKNDTIFAQTMATREAFANAVNRAGLSWTASSYA